MKVIAKAPGKLVLLGEYAVLEGAPALVAAVDRVAKVIVEHISEKSFVIHAPDIYVPNLAFNFDIYGKIQFLKSPLKNTLKKLKFFVSILEQAEQLLTKRGIRFSPVKISLDTSEFFLKKGAAKLGLGSSAALTVALLAALFDYYQVNDLDQSGLYQKALTIHRVAQGNVGSGVDVAASIFGHLLLYQLHANKENSIKPMSMPEGLFMLPVWTGKSSSTRRLVQKFYSFKDRCRQEYEMVKKDLFRFSQQGCDDFENKNVNGFLAVIQSYFQQMKYLGDKINAPIVSVEHQKIADLAAKKGAVYKPSGAGGGDLGIVFSHSHNDLKNVEESIIAAGFDIVPLCFSNPGVTVIQNEVSFS